jgi:hypothetical protein
MLPKPFAFYNKGKSVANFRHSTTFHMYFAAWRQHRGRWAPGNIDFVKWYTKDKPAGKALPPPPWYKVLKGGGTGGGGGGGGKPKPPKPPIPEPTSLALLGGGAMFLVRRKREA